MERNTYAKANVARRVEDLCAQFRRNQTHKILFQDWTADGGVPLFNVRKHLRQTLGPVGKRWMTGNMVLYPILNPVCRFLKRLLSHLQQKAPENLVQSVAISMLLSYDKGNNACRSITPR